MINATPFEWAQYALISFLGGVAIAGLATFFIMRNIQERKRRRPTPIIQSMIHRYGDILYDERFTKMPDREFIKLLRDSGWVILWLIIEASIRLMKKTEKTEAEKKP